MVCPCCTSNWKSLSEGDPCPSCEEDVFDGDTTVELTPAEIEAIKEKAERAARESRWN